ncbi:MAG: phosphoglycerol transferase MdoB-like AlkP superfamily enzyme [Litorivivens sp.]
MKAPLSDRIIDRIYPLALGLIALLMTFLAIRVYELIYFRLTEELVLDSNLLVSAFENEAILIGLIGLGIAFFSWLLGLLHKKLGSTVFFILGFVLLTLDLTLTHVFITNHILADASLMNISFIDMGQIAGAEMEVDRLGIWGIHVFGVAIFILLSWLVSKSKSHNRLVKYLVLIGVMIWSISAIKNRDEKPSRKEFSDGQSWMIANSKVHFFGRSIDNITEAGSFETQVRWAQECEKYWQLTPEFKHTDSKYPLLHNEDRNNVLEPFFPRDSIMPHVVLIVSESLAPSYCGKNNFLGTAATFTDSLRRQSLYWENMLSNADRSWGPITNLLGSLPFGLSERGLVNTNIGNEQKWRYPASRPIFEQFGDLGYHSRYFYAGYGAFDNVSRWLLSHPQLHEYRDYELFDEKYMSDGQFEQVKNNGIWGYSDKVLFNQGIDLSHTPEPGRPFLDVYQTLTFHSPYNMADSIYYTREYLDSRVAEMEMTEVERGNLGDNVLASMMFADDALKEFMTSYKDLPHYENTIFLIVGDHGWYTGAGNRFLGHYQVPLIIYSPMLESTEEFEGLCSHLDILPSLMALLEGNFGAELPLERSEVGQGLDTSRIFRADRMIPLNFYSDALPKLVYKNELLIGDEVFTFDSTFQFTEHPNPSESKVQAAYDVYNAMNRYCCGSDMIIRKD